MYFVLNISSLYTRNHNLSITITNFITQSQTLSHKYHTITNFITQIPHNHSFFTQIPYNHKLYHTYTTKSQTQIRRKGGKGWIRIFEGKYLSLYYKDGRPVSVQPYILFKQDILGLNSNWNMMNVWQILGSVPNHCKGYAKPKNCAKYLKWLRKLYASVNRPLINTLKCSKSERKHTKGLTKFWKCQNWRYFVIIVSII